MTVRSPFRTLLLLSTLSFAACAPELDSSGDTSRADEQEASQYVGLWTGMDETQTSCEVEVLSYEEHVDEKIPGADDELASRNLSKLRRNMRVRVSMQTNQETIFEARSSFDEESTAYAAAELHASNPLDDVLSETLIITLDPATDTVTSFKYNKDASKECKDLRRIDSGTPTEPDPEQPKPEIVPHKRGAPRR